MKGFDKKLVAVMDGADKRFVIPVYQRNYDWKKDNCRQLLQDLLNVIERGKESHFFGSIVSHTEGSDYIIIDGQQRLTTVSLLLIALRDLVKEDAIPFEDTKLVNRITNTYLTDEYSDHERKMKLKPVKNDMAAFDKLFEGPKEFDYSSNITQNYLFFYEEIKRSGVKADDLLAAIKKLVVIDITLGSDDDPQLIFESLNSTGMDLSEADKIRNYVLMGQPQKTQELLYEKFWNRIEELTRYEVSDFIRQYLTMKTRKWPAMSAVYKAFKDYSESKALAGEELLADMRKFAEYFEQISKANTAHKDVNKVLKRLARLELSVANPFLFGLLDKLGTGEIQPEDAVVALEAIESYLFRRIVCDVPTSALNKVFATLNNEVLKAIEDDSDYVGAVVYILEHKVGSGRFPVDSEFVEKVKTRDFYHMHQKNKIYYFDRLENGNSKEYLDVEQAMLADDDGLSVEHVMPQTLSEAWKRYLGANAIEVHETWVHRIANLTLTAYNSKYSNRSFAEKLTMEHGFKNSPLPLNKWIAEQDEWREEQLEARSELMAEMFLKLWTYPKTAFEPKTKTKLEFGLDEGVDFKGTDIASFTLLGSKYQVNSWKEAADQILGQVCELDPAKMRSLANLSDFPGTYLDIDREGDHGWNNIGHGIYAYLSTSTRQKIRLIESVFEEVGIDFEDLTFEIYPTETDEPDFVSAVAEGVSKLDRDALDVIDDILSK